MLITTTKKLKLPASEVWNVLGEGFGNVMWINGVKSCKFDGDLKIGNARVVEMTGMGTVTERLELFNPQSHTIRYSVEGGLPIIKNASNHWTIEKIDDQNCIITCQSNLKVKAFVFFLSPLLRFLMASTVKGLIEMLEKEVMRKIQLTK
ncbi:MAG: hypothetical protein RLZZ175_3155 [Bacteroidota bacterium]|jgi:hypothetical protein